MQRGLRVITLWGAIEKSSILEIRIMDGNIIISYFGGSNNIFANCILSDFISDRVVKIKKDCI